MATVKVHLRVGRAVVGRSKGVIYVDAGKKPNHEPLRNAQGAIPTVAFAVNIDVPDHLFRNAERVIADLKVTSSKANICAEVQAP